MTASATPLPAVRAALGALVDYAGLFPPAQLPLEPALEKYLTARRGGFAWMLGRFIVRLSQIDQLAAAVPAGERLGVSLILDQGLHSVEWAAQLPARSHVLTVEALEIALAGDEVAGYSRLLDENGLRALPNFVETPAECIAELARHGLGAKLRCGGLSAGAYPAPAHVAAFIESACRHGVPFKATAGLHHPVRHYNEAAGVTMHGFLNLLAATALAREGAALDRITAAIAEENVRAFALGPQGLLYDGTLFDAYTLRELRAQNFIAYGSCSFSEPVDDLLAMGMLS